MTCQTFTGTMALVHAITGENVFAGTSVVIKGFTANGGTSNSEASVELDLVYHQCSNLGAGNLDVGFPVIFTCNGFIFGGFVDRIEFNESESGLGWKVRITDPRKFLDNVKILLDGYYCSINGITNFINVQSLLEGTSAGICLSSPPYILNPQPPFPTTTEVNLPNVNVASLCSSYGYGKLGSGRTSYWAALSGIQIYGPPLYTIQGQPIFYNLNPIINELINVPWAATDSPNTTLLQLISSACDEAGFDFIVNLEFGGTITLNLVDRRIETSLSQLSNIKQYYQDVTKTLISSSRGTETSYQTTKKIIIGDNVQYLKYGYSYTQTRMVLGYDNFGTPILATPDELSYGVNINTSVLSAMLATQGVSLPFNCPIKEAEILSATGGYDFWLAYSTQNPTSIGGLVGNQVFGVWADATTAIAKGLNKLEENSIEDAKGHVFNKGIAQLKNSDDLVAQEIMQTVHKWITSWASEFYGVQWMIDLPRPICYKGYVGPGPSVGGSSQSTLVSDEISDGGWTNGSNVLGLIPNTEDTTLFQTNDRRITCFVAVPTQINNSRTGRQVPFNGQLATFYLSPDKLSQQFYTKNTYVYIPADAENKIYYRGPTTIGVMLKLSGMIGCGYAPVNPNTVSKGLEAMALMASPPPSIPPNATGSTNTSTTAYNVFKVGTAAAMFTHACIPFKSNMYVYGPWGSQTFVEGGTEIVKENDLNPWTYGSFELMNQVGEALSAEGLRSQVKSETGSLVVAEAPAYSLGPLIGYAGLILSSVVVNFGSSGITTTYSFQNFSPKFGNYAKNLSDRIKETSALKKELYDTIRNSRQKNLSALNAMRTGIFNAKIKSANLQNTQVSASESPGAPSTSSTSSTPVNYIIGSYGYKPYTSFPPTGLSSSSTSGPVAKEKLDCNTINSPPSASYTSSTVGSPVPSTDKISGCVGLDKVYSGSHYADKNRYISYAITSLDALLTPVSIYGEGGLPRFSLSSLESPISFFNKPRPVMPPVSTNVGIVGELIINGYFLNPMTSSAALGSWGDRAIGSTNGFSLQTITYGSDPRNLFNPSDEDGDKSSVLDFRFNALKGPLVLQSWGYDTEGKPIPNAVDGPADCIAGYFEKTGLQDRFMPNWQSDSRVWPVGPIDLRWDRDRGVWVSPPSEKLVIAQILSDLTPQGSAQAILLNPTGGAGSFYQDHDVYGPQGQHITGDITGATIIVDDFLGRKLCKGTVIYAYHYGQGRYLALETSVVDETTCTTCSSGSSSGSQTEESGTSATSEASGTSATSETSGTSATSEASGTSATSETSGTSATSEASGTSATSEASGTSATSETSGSSSSLSSSSSSSSSESDTCNECGLLDCFEAIYGAPLGDMSGVLGVANGCLTIYPLLVCPSQENQQNENIFL